MSTLVALPVLVALASVVATLVTRERPALQRAVSVLGGLSYAAGTGWLAWRIVLAPDAAGGIAYQIGGWPAPFGITLVADGLSVFMLTIVGVLVAATAVFSVRFIDRDNQRVFYHPLFHALVLGVSGAFLTGDLFNLFVWFEVILIVSYVFVAFYGGPQQTAGAFRYLALNIVGSVLFLLAIGGLYATLGTLNMAEMARLLANPAATGVDALPVVGLAGLLLAAFALKAGLVPFQFWVPAAYVAAPMPVVALLAGVTKKVGIYAIVRMYFTVFSEADLSGSLSVLGGDSPLALLAPVLLVMSAASILVGGLGAVGRSTIERTLAYSSIGQVGFIAVPVAVAAGAGSPSLRRLGLLAAVVYAFHHALTKALLFLAAASVRDATGTNELSQLGGLAGRAPVVGGAFFLGGLSLVGIPPLTGFFGKLFVFDAAVTSVTVAPTPVGVAVVAVLLAGAVLTIAYTTRVWSLAFLGGPSDRVETATVDGVQLVVLAVLAGALVVVGVGFDPLYRLAEAAAEAALDSGGYTDLVDPLEAVP